MKRNLWYIYIYMKRNLWEMWRSSHKLIARQTKEVRELRCSAQVAAESHQKRKNQEKY